MPVKLGDQASVPTIDILLATYNGAAFLPEQLASLAAQSLADWRVIVRDDGSIDGSLDLVRGWAQAGGYPLIVIEDGRRNLGAKGNFAALLEASDAPWFACCDQDDVWLPEKLELMLARARAVAAQVGAERPVLVYSDLQVVGADLTLIHPSFRKYASLHPPRAGRAVIDLMTQNVVTGCASLGNAALRQAALPIPAEAIMHDWWLALVAAAAGELVAVPEATVLYRQHGGNAIGAVRWTATTAVRRLIKDFRKTRTEVQSQLKGSRAQACELLERHTPTIDSATAGWLSDFARLAHGKFFTKVRFCVANAMTIRRAARMSAMILFF